MSEPALSLAFFDPAGRLSGTARAGATLLFEGRQVSTINDPPDLERNGDRFSARSAGHFELDFEPLADAARLPGSTTWLCAVRGRAQGRAIDCLGTATETTEAPRWAELDLIRAVSAVLDRENAVFLTATRERDVPGHGHEQVHAVIVAGGSALEVEDARLSTVYDREGRQRTAGLELWLPGEDFARRGSGTAQAGASIVLGGVRVDAAVFQWQMEGRSGAGAYELAVRDDEEPAA